MNYNTPSYKNTVDRMEPNLGSVLAEDTRVSIAISLRRIADALCETNRLLVIIADKIESIEMSVRK